MIPGYIVDLESWILCGYVILTSLIISSILKLLMRNKADIEGVFWTIYAFSIMGIVIGVLISNSREAAVPAVIPAIISLIGGLSIYIIGVKSEDYRSRILVSFCMISLSISLIIGTSWGAIMRGYVEEYENSAEAQMLKAVIEEEVRLFREALGVPQKPNEK